LQRYNNNLVHLELVADALKDVLDEVTFVGGCTTILLVDAAALGDAIRSSEIKVLPSGVKIRVVSPGYFLATKFEAFLGRGKGDHAGSHDLEDIVFVLENRTGLVRELIDYPHKLKVYLAGQARNLLNDKFLYVLPGLVSNSGGQHAVEGYLKIISKWGA
jgi:hypothetical protein